METKELQKQLKGIADTLLDVVYESGRAKYRADEGLQKTMLRAGAIVVYNALEEILNQSK